MTSILSIFYNIIRALRLVHEEVNCFDEQLSEEKRESPTRGTRQRMWETRQRSVCRPHTRGPGSRRYS
ncbi:Hypothetical protein SMAX5B_016341 [Scophthalmus maximus]|uniref:Uncharacterized protein n=1 Tax=Scophthalmus maximus TaxID=52904 RepID=A0A2U9BM41_SCOMX|nr:Hypothetical protein SMAX5B_016341 [Scophthalmus maximus]